ncbi:MAG: hypothetical protein V3V11_03795 [Vicinamibacteria bacterium]
MMSRQSIAMTALLFSSLVATYPVWAGEKGSDLVQAQTAPPEASLLDIGILVFDLGLPDDARGLRKLEAMGIFEEVRRSEALYIPVHLERTLQKAGFWGAVRLVPSASIVDVTVSGTILSSNGGELKLKIRAVDSRGKVWLDKRYKGKANASIYLRRESTDEPFQELYNQIANDLLSKRKQLGEKNVQAIDTISRLRFAADLAPVALSDYLETKKKNRYSVARLPARDDPMMARVDKLRQRDRMFIDVLDTHYGDFYTQMQEAYSGWRSQNYWEREALKHSAESSTGGGTSVGIISTSGVLPWEGTGPVCGTPGVFGGFEQKKRFEQVQREAEAKKKSHIEELRELGASLASDMTPLLVEVEGKVLQLTGSVEAQYASWRELLREIFATETGLPVISSSAPVDSDDS